tara:strand:+ start:3748 stop:4896 length:1149 start_codon:yes stop_codon:yes gene_type:complete
MAVVSVKILHDGWTGEFAQSGTAGFKVVYLVEVDDPKDGNFIVSTAAGLPRIGDAYNVGSDHSNSIRLKSFSTQPVAGTRNLWQVSANYGSMGEDWKGARRDGTDGFDDEGKPTDNPLAYAVSMSVSTTRVARDATRGTYLGKVTDANGGRGALDNVGGFNDGNVPPQPHNFVKIDADGEITNGRAITNSVFRPFDPPPQIEYNRTNVKIKWNQHNTPNRMLTFVNSINSRALTINVIYHWDDEFGDNDWSTGHVSIPRHAGRIMGLSASPSMINGIGYHDCEIEIEIDTLYTWRIDVLDRGYANLELDSFFSNAPNKGVPKTSSDVSVDGFASREPVLLDGNGQALNVAKYDGVFLRYGVYPELNWGAVLADPKNLKDMDN